MKRRKIIASILILTILTFGICWRTSNPVVNADAPAEVGIDTSVLGDTLKQDIHDFVASGTDKSVSHIWTVDDTYMITAYSEDNLGNIGLSSTFTVTIPRDKAINNPFLRWLQSHPNLFPFLQKIIQNLGL